MAIVLQRRSVVIARDAKLGEHAVGPAHAKITFANESVFTCLTRYLERLVEKSDRARDVVFEAVPPSQPDQYRHLGYFGQTGEVGRLFVFRYGFKLLATQSALFEGDAQQASNLRLFIV